jgi:hypothetical protein
MSKDKGSKNTKKAPADKSAGSSKKSDYKTENKSRNDKQPPVSQTPPTKVEPKMDKKGA